ncbi:LexA repressor [compost metagenome]
MRSRQQAIINFINSYGFENGYPPTVREIGKQVGLTSSSTVQGHIDRLERDGFITKKGKSSRTITLTDKGLKSIGHQDDSRHNTNDYTEEVVYSEG